MIKSYPERRAPRLRMMGVTLVELAVTLGIVGILATIAVPSLTRLQHNAARTAAVNDFMHTVFLARSEAIKRNAVVSVCRSVDGKHCANRTANWETGWLVFVNTDRDQPADRDTGEEILHRNDGWNGGRITSNRLSFSFRPTAQGDVNGTILFCDPRGHASDARAIIISHTGRARISRRDSRGKALRCG